MTDRTTAAGLAPRRSYGRAVVIAAAILVVVVSSSVASAKTTADPTAASLSWVKKNIPGVSPKLVNAACKQAKLSLETTINAGFDDLFKQFEKDIPCINVSDFQASGGALAVKFAAEQAANSHNTDVVIHSSPASLDDWTTAGYLGKFKPVDSARVPKRWKREGSWYVIGLNNVVMAWNKNAVSSAQEKKLLTVKTWKQVFNLGSLGLQGHSGIVNVKAGGSVQLIVYGLTYVQRNGLDLLQSAFKPTIYASATPMAGDLASGRISAIVAGESTSIETAWLAGAPIEWAYPTPNLAIPTGMAIAKGAPHAAAAELFEDWALSRPGQIAFTQYGGYSPVPVTPAIPDLRPYAKSSWFHEPRTLYFNANWTVIGNTVGQLTSQFNSAFGIH